MKKLFSLRRLVALFLLVVFCSSQAIVSVSALSSDQKTLLDQKTLHYDICVGGGSAGGGGGGGGSISLDGETTEPKEAVRKVVWATLIQGGIDEIHAAAVMGNFDQEGAWDPMNAGYAPNNIQTKNPRDPKAIAEGYGLMGWTPGTFLTQSMKDAGISGKPYTAETQAAVVLAHIRDKTSIYEKGTGKEFLAKKTIEDATIFFLGGPGWGFERPADSGAAEQAQRIARAKDMLRKYSGSTVTVGGGESKNIYVLGDSISVIAKDKITTEFKNQGAEKVTINASSSRSITQAGDTPGFATNGLQAVDKDGKDIKDADKIVVELGTNQRDTNFRKSIGDLYQKIRGYNKDAPIYWVGVFSEGGKNGYAKINQSVVNGAIQDQARSLDFTYIDTTKANIPLSDSVHQTHPEGSEKLVGTIVESVFSAGATPSDEGAGDSSGSGCVCKPAGQPSPGTTILSGNTNAEKAFNFLVDTKGLGDKAAAAIVGSLMLESGGNTENIDPTITNSIGAHGIAQWYEGRRTELQEFAADKGTDEDDFVTQLEFLWHELTEKEAYAALYQLYKTSDDLVKMAEEWEHQFEISGVMGTRVENAKTIFNKYGDGGGGGGGSTVSPVSENCECSVDQVSAALDPRLKKLAEENGGKTQISAASVNGALKGNAGGNVQMPTRSSYKVYTAYATLKAIEDGKISWSSNTSWGQSVEATMEAMIIRSDNDAALALRTDSRIGTHTQVTNLLQNQVGLSSKTVMGSGGTTNSNSLSTANDFVKFLTVLEKRKLPGVTKSSNYDKLLDFMKKATTDGGSARAGIVAGVGDGTAVAGVGDGTAVADKPGWAGPGEDQASNDIGIVYLKGSPYVLAILTDKPNQWDGVAHIAKEVHAMMGGGEAGSSECSGAVPGDFTGTVKAYAWPTHHDADYLKMMPAYKDAVGKAVKQGRYVGGGANPGIDCGGFVTTLMIDSGFEPNYNYKGKGGPTTTQEQWLKENWQKISPGSTKDLQPGDVAINDSHTYVYVGTLPGFHSSIASASYGGTGGGWRAPMAGEESPADSSFNWYRKK